MRTESREVASAVHPVSPPGPSPTRIKTRRESRLASALVGLLGMLLLVVMTRSSLPQTSLVTLTASGDTCLRQGTPNANQGVELLLRLQQSGDNRVLVQFDQQALEQAVGNARIRSAKLRLYITSNTNNWGTEGREVNVHRLTQAWTEGGATWNCQEDTDPSNNSADCVWSWAMGGSTLPPFLIAPTEVVLHQNNQTGWVEWEVVGDVEQFLSHEAANYGWVVRKDEEGAAGQVEYASRENTHAPQLVIELGEAAPTTGPRVSAITDTEVRSGAPNQNQGNRMRLQVQGAGNNRVLVQFDRQALLQRVGSGTLQTAKLRLYIVANANNWGSSGRAVNVHRMTQAWSEQGATWNCADDANRFNSQADCSAGWKMASSSQWPFLATAASTLLHQNNQTGWVEWEVTTDVAQVLAGSVPNYGWIIRKDNEGQAGQVEYGSRESLHPPEIVLTVQASNQAPQVSAGPDQTIALPDPASLSGLASDDGLPSGSALAYVWSQVSGPGTATFALPNSATTSVNFSLPGTYVLRLAASDSELSANDDLTVVVNPQPSTNQAPQVSAGPDQSLTLPTHTVNLTGVVSDDGLPLGASVTSTWSIISGPGIVTFATVNAPSTTATFATAGTYVLRLTASDSVLISSDDISVTAMPANEPPHVSAGADHVITLPATASLAGTASDDGLPAGSNLTVAWSMVSGPGAVTFSNPEAEATTGSFSAAGTYVLRLTASDSVLTSSDEVSVTVNPAGPPLPPDPLTVAPPLDRTVPTTVFAATEFLYTGSNPIQTGVVPGTIQPLRVAVLRGKVSARGGNPISGVAISVLNHPEFGQTLTRADGAFDLAVNGGGVVTVNYENAGLLPVQRQIKAPWQDYVWLPEVVMIPLDARVTTIQMNSGTPMQVARGTVVTDNDGVRQATLLFPSGTTATMILPNGSTQVLSSLQVRATEYTVGDNGPAAMPGDLPPQSAYTYAIEHSVDEALAAGALSVQFSQPVVHYLENFLRVKPGQIVPAGYYDRKQGAWVPSDNGLVVHVLSVVDGQAILDLDGSGQAATPDAYAARGITGAERQQLASLYQPGQSLWRVPVDHFTAWDFNFGFPISPGQVPNQPEGQAKDQQQERPDCQTGSIVECQNQVLGEALPIVGTPFALHYRSDQVAGRRVARQLDIPLTGATLPEGLQQVRLVVNIAGQELRWEFAPVPNLRHSFEWNGRDAYGRLLNGTQKAQVHIGYVYRPDYSGGYRFALPTGFRILGLSTSGGAGAGTAIEVRAPILAWQDYEVNLGLFDAKSLGLGGWRLSHHHVYDPVSRMLLEGNGQRRGIQAVAEVISTVAGGGQNEGWSSVPGGVPGPTASFNPKYLAAAADGSVYASDGNLLARLAPDGRLSRVSGFNGEIRGLAVDELNRLYIASSSQVRRLNPNGTVTVVAGAGVSPGYSGDGGPATQAQINVSAGLALAADGTLYLAGGSRLRKVSPGGIIETLAGDGVAAYSGDNGPALSARVNNPALPTVNPDGTLYFTDFNPAAFGSFHIRRITPGGIISTVATTNIVEAMAAASDGSLYFAEFNIGFTIFGSREFAGVSRLLPDGGRQSVVPMQMYRDHGFGILIEINDGSSPARAVVYRIDGLVLAPGGDLYLSHTGRVRRVRVSMPELHPGENLISSLDGSEVYVFDATGRHLRTIDALTSGLHYRFDYDTTGQLISITDGDNNVTTLQSSGLSPQAIVGPFGQTTSLAVDGNGYLSAVTNPANESVSFSYHSEGLLATMTDARQHVYQFQHDADGRLTQDADPGGGFLSLNRNEGPGQYQINLGTSLSNTTSYLVEALPGGGWRRLNTFPDGTSLVRTFSIHGTESTTAPNGSASSLVQGPDPRWGMQAPLASSVVATTPGGLSATVSSGRTANLSEASNPLSLTTQTDTVTINGRTYNSTYAASTRTFTHTTPVGRQSTSAADHLGRPLQSQFAFLHPVRFSYDSRGRLETIQQGNGAEERTTTLAYNDEGTLQTVTDPLSRVVRFQYDLAGRVMEQTLPGNRVISFNYDASGNLVSLTPPGKPQHGFDYTEVGLMKEYDPPLAPHTGTRVTTYSYDTERKPTLLTRPDGQTMAFDYDSAGRLSALNLPGRQLTYGYSTTTGNVTSITDSTGSSLSYTYDGSLPKSTTWSGTVNGSVSRNYDNNFRVTSRSINGSHIVNFGYDNDSLLTSAGSLTLGRNLQNGLLTGTTLGSVTDGWGYNSFGEPTSYSASVSGSPVYSTTFTRDQLGRITTKAETVQGVTDNYVYSYDPAGRLETITRNGALFSAYAYDTNGNRLSAQRATNPEPLTTYTYDAQDRLLTGDSGLGNPHSFTYTANGELLSKTNGSQATTYQYDVLGNLRHVRLPDGTQVDYVIDAQNRRVGKKVNGVLVQGWLYANQLNPIAELDGSNQIVSTFVYGSRSNVPDYMMRNGVSYRIVSDHLGSPRLVINSSDGSIAQRLDYDEFGNVLQDTNPNFQPFGFAGGLYDPQTQLIRFGARDYDAEVGRWTAKDPIGFQGRDANLYGYVVNNPISFVDPLGTDYWDWLASFSNFSNGFADHLTSGFGLAHSVGLPSLTEYLHQGTGTSGLVNRCSGLYTAGQWAGTMWSVASGVAGSLNGGAQSIFYNGRGALEEATHGSGKILAGTLGGKLLNMIDKQRELPDFVWRAASAVFAANAKGTAQVFLRPSVNAGGVWNTVESPILNFLGVFILPK